MHTYTYRSCIHTIHVYAYHSIVCLHSIYHVQSNPAYCSRSRMFRDRFDFCHPFLIQHSCQRLPLSGGQRARHVGQFVHPCHRRARGHREWQGKAGVSPPSQGPEGGKRGEGGRGDRRRSLSSLRLHPKHRAWEVTHACPTRRVEGHRANIVVIHTCRTCRRSNRFPTKPSPLSHTREQSFHSPYPEEDGP